MQSRSTHPPTPADLTHLRPSDAAGSAVTLVAIVATVIALTLSMRAEVWLWLPGQIILAVALVQWFAILHECGHETLFRSRSIHRAIGQVAGFFSIIPFYNWKRVHGRHHKWTGWQDVDPTTATLVPRELSRVERVLVARGSMPYSAVTQPLPVPRRNGGTLSSMLAAQMTRVSPTSISTEPSACARKLGVSRTGRSSSRSGVPSTAARAPASES